MLPPTSVGCRATPARSRLPRRAPDSRARCTATGPWWAACPRSGRWAGRGLPPCEGAARPDSLRGHASRAGRTCVPPDLWARAAGRNTLPANRATARGALQRARLAENCYFLRLSASNNSCGVLMPNHSPGLANLTAWIFLSSWRANFKTLFKPNSFKPFTLGMLGNAV